MERLIIYLQIFVACWSIAKGITIESANTNVTLEKVPNQDNYYIMQMNENNHDFDADSQTPLIKITDGSFNNLVPATSNSFRYNLTDKVLYSMQSFDYDTMADPKYIFSVFDMNGNSTVITFNIINIDDEPPSLTSPLCTFDEATLYTVDDTPCNATLSDPDGWIGYTKFTLLNFQNGADNDTFALEFMEFPDNKTTSVPVYITLKKELDYNIASFHSFDIEAQDEAGHPTTPEPYVKALIYVNDIRNTPPAWTKILAYEKFDEKTIQVFQVQAVDGDKGIAASIYYEITEQDDPEANYVQIDKENGTIFVDKIDRDKNDITTYNFEVMAYVAPNLTEWRSKIEVTFFINDIDDHPPEIKWVQINETNTTFDDSTTEKEIKLKFIENYAGRLNTTIFIEDIDWGTNAQFTIELEEVEDHKQRYTEAFMVVPTSALRSGNFELSVKNATHLDFEDEDWKAFQFYVVAKEIVNETMTDRILVDIHLIDYNDEYPKFNETEFTITILETAKKDTVITQITATDRDAEDKDSLVHTLIQNGDTLKIEEQFGQITVNVDNAFDYDTANPIFVQVQAKDHVGHTATVPLTINLEDVNNKAPIITVDDATSVTENQAIGVELNISISATDPDTTGNLTAEIDWLESVALKNSKKLDLTNDTIFQLVKFLDVEYSPSNSRVITINLVVNDNNPNNTTPDFETFDSLILSLVVWDWNTDAEFMDKNHSSTKILITIIDINDNTPFFPEGLPDAVKPNRTVTENARKGTPVGSISAVDLDVGDTITYKCSANDEKLDWIEVNPNTGEFSVKDDNLVDADSGPTYYFNYTCTATDPDPTHISEPLTVSFYILDTNNKVPNAEIDNEIEIVEKSKAGTIVSDIVTSDADRDLPFHTVVCFFPSSMCEQFTIDDNTVKVRNGGKDIDRDYGSPNFTCKATCRDNPDRALGDLTQLETSVNFLIKLLDINDHAPELVNGSAIYVYENITKDETLSLIVGMDPDFAENGTILFSLTNATDENNKDATDLFDIQINDEDYYIDEQNKQAHLIAKQNLRNHYGTYTINLELRDNSSVPLSSEATLNLEIKKFNFESPRFVYPTNGTSFSLAATQQKYGQLKHFKNAEDLANFNASDNSQSDSCKRWNLQFDVNQIEPSDKPIFEVSPLGNCEFQLQVNSNFDTGKVLDQTYKVELIAKVSDGEPLDNEAPYVSTEEITVKFIEQSPEPIFPYNKWTIQFVENDASLNCLINDSYQAKYEEEDDDSVVYYHIVAGKPAASFFDIKNSTGLVFLKQELDYETYESFDFKIIASNNPTEYRTEAASTMDVHVIVIDINDNVPQWTKDNFYGSIMSPFQPNFQILTVTATDADKIDQGKLKYSIKDDYKIYGTGFQYIGNKPFYVNEHEGNIYLNFSVDSTMTGYIEFVVQVQDQQDEFGNGPHYNYTTVTVYIISAESIVVFKFENTKAEVLEQEKLMLDIITDIVDYKTFRQDIETPFNDTTSTNAKLYFIDFNSEDSDLESLKAATTTSKVMDATEMLRIVSSYTIYSSLKVTLRNETGLILENFPTDNKQENLEPVLKAWLIGVSVVLGALCIVLLITFILKTRQLNRTISNLVSKTYGSQESGLNRLGVSVPTANKHAVEGSNPIFSIDKDGKEKELYDFDEQKSVNSGDSDLVGIEDNPEFDYHHQKHNETNHM